MNYVLSCSGIISPVAIHLLNSGKKVTVVTYSEDVKKFCIAMNIKFIDYEIIKPGFEFTHRPTKLFRRVINVIIAIKTLKNRLDGLIKTMHFSEEDNFHLLTSWIAYDNFYLAKELSKNGKGSVYFSGINWQERKACKWKFNYAFFGQVFLGQLLKLFLGLDLFVCESVNNLKFAIDEKFMRKNNIIKNCPEKPFVEFMVDVITNNQISRKQYENMLIGEGSGITNRIDYNSLNDVYKCIADLPLEIVMKKHPVAGKNIPKVNKIYEELFGDCEEFPSYIPAELVLRNIKRNVIAVSSTPLIAASQLKHISAISLLELVGWYDETKKNNMKNDLMKMSKNKIIFVKTFEQLKQTLTQ